MIKFVLQHVKLYQSLQSIPFVRKFFVYDVSKLNRLKVGDVFDLIFSDISNPNGTSKTTSKNRFLDLDEWCLKYISADRQLEVHDVAVSSGITSINLFKSLEAGDKLKSFNVSDKYSELSYKGKWIKRFYDSNGVCTFIYVFGLYAIKQTSWFFFMSKFFFSLFSSKLETPPDGKVTLFHPELMKKVESGEIGILEYDVFSSSINESFDLVRCMNLLNPLQFSDEQIKKAINNLTDSLRESGLLIIGRSTMSGEHRVSILQKTGVNLVMLGELNGGAELKHLF